MFKRGTLKKALSVFLAIVLVIIAVPFNADIVDAAGDGSSYASAEKLQFNQVKNIAFDRNKKNYFCEFKVTEKGVVSIDSVDQFNNEHPYNLQLTLYNKKDGKIIWGDKRFSYNSINPNFNTKVGLNPGEYILMIDDKNAWNREEIKLKLSFKANNYCEVESNDTVATATPMKTNVFYDVYFGNGYMSGDIEEYDYFKFTAEKGKFYRFTVSNYDIVKDTTIIFDIYRPDGQEVPGISKDEIRDEQGNHYSQFLAEQSGVYTIKIHNYGQKQIGFKMKVAKCPFYPEATREFKAELSTRSGGYDDVNLYWNETKGATGYYIYYRKSTDKSYKYLVKTTRTSYPVKNLADGAKYYFAVKPYYNDGTKNYVAKSWKYVSIYTLKRVTTPSVVRYSKYSPGYVYVKWKNIAGERGYEISRSTSKSKVYLAATASSYSNQSLIKTTANRGYYYRVRAYSEIYRNGKFYKIYGPWSNARYYVSR